MALHVRSHQRAVRVVVLQKRNQRRRNRNQLLGRNVDELDGLLPAELEFALLSRRDEFVGEASAFVEARVGLRDDMTHLLGRRYVFDVIRNLLVDNFPVGRLDEAVLVNLGERRQRIDESDVRTFGRLDRADAAVMGRMDVANLESGPLPRQASRTQCRQPPLVRDLRQRVRLVHELRQLRRAEEFADRRRGRFRVDQVLRHHIVDLDRSHPLFDRFLHAQQAGAVLVLHEFANRPHPAVAEMVDVVHGALAVAQIDKRLDASDDVFPSERALLVVRFKLETHIHLDPANGGQIVAVGIVQGLLEKLLRSVFSRRFAGTQHAEDVHERGYPVVVLVHRHGVADVGADIDSIDVKNRNVRDVLGKQEFQRFISDLVAGFDPDLAGLLVDHVNRDESPVDVLERNDNLLDDFVSGPFSGHPGCDLLAGLRDDLTCGGVDDIKRRLGAADPVREKFRDPGARVRILPVIPQLEVHRVVEGSHDGFLIETQCEKHRRDRKLPAAVDASVYDVLRVELEIDPRPSVGNDPAGVEELAGRMSFSAVMVEEHARRPVHL